MQDNLSQKIKELQAQVNKEQQNNRREINAIKQESFEEGYRKAKAENYMELMRIVEQFEKGILFQMIVIGLCCLLAGSLVTILLQWVI